MTDPTKKDQSAFPVLDSPDGSALYCRDAGMTLRDWLAGQAMAGLIDKLPFPPMPTKEALQRRLERTSMYAYQYADAMLREREK